MHEVGIMQTEEGIDMFGQEKGYILITGVSSGIGSDLARVFAREVHDLVLTFREDKMYVYGKMQKKAYPENIR